jgi:hypothetical protein
MSSGQVIVRLLSLIMAAKIYLLLTLRIIWLAVRLCA